MMYMKRKKRKGLLPTHNLPTGQDLVKKRHITVATAMTGKYLSGNNPRQDQLSG